MDFITNLPRDVSRYILEFVDYYEVPAPAYLAIKDEIQTYYLDHNWENARVCPFYYVHNYMSFTNYYFDKQTNEYSYVSYYKELRNGEFVLKPGF